MEYNNITILVIADNQGNLIALEALIRKAFPESIVFTALNGKKGLAIAAQEEPDVILLDIVMPKMNGFKICAKLKADKLLREIPVVFVTEIKLSKEEQIHAQECGAEVFLLKPIDTYELTTQINALVKINFANKQKHNENERLTVLVEKKTKQLFIENEEKDKRAAELVIANKELAYQNEEKDKRAAELVIANKELAYQNEEKDKRAAELVIANKELAYQNKEKDKRAAELVIANEEKDKRAAELVIANREKDKRAAELVLANKEKDKRAAELVFAIKELAYQAELVIANKELAYQNKEKDKQAAELVIANKEKSIMVAYLNQQQRLDSIGTLAGGVAHEINNPINGIMNYGQLILDSLDADSENAEYAKEIIFETNRIAVIVKNLLQFSRNEKEEHNYANVKNIIEQTLSLIKTVIKHDQIDLQIDVPEDLPQLKCISQQIQQVIMNLMTNSRDALNEKYEGYHEDKIIKLYCKQFNKENHKWIRITVEDHGNGIPEAIKEKVFEPFFSSKSRDAGTGLGLSISHGIIKDHHGELSFETKEGFYTKFYLDLPVDNE